MSHSKKVFEAEHMENCGEELVVGYGSEIAISLAKYHAYSCETPLAIYPVGNFLDFTFSRFARLFDGVEYGFFDTAEPEYIFVSLSENPYSELQSYFLSSKYIALFDDIVAEQVYQVKHCEKMKNFLKRTLQTYIKSRASSPSEKNSLNIWTLIRLGQAMSYFGQTKFFFGGDRAIVERLCMLKRDADYLEMEVASLKLVINAYSCFYSSSAVEGSMNPSRHIDLLSRTFKLSPSLVIKKLAGSNLFFGGDAINNLKGKYPYLASVFDKALSKIFSLVSCIDNKINPLKKYGLKARQVEICFALAPDFYHTPSTMHLLSSLGYMDKLL